MTQLFGSRRTLPALFFIAFAAQTAIADDELLLYVFDGDEAVEGATVTLDGEAVGYTRRDGSLFADLEGVGQRVLAVSGPGGASQRQRFSSGSGQLVDIVVDLGAQENTPESRCIRARNQLRNVAKRLPAVCRSRSAVVLNPWRAS
jgi:hypothetical protein